MCEQIFSHERLRRDAGAIKGDERQASAFQGTEGDDCDPAGRQLDEAVGGIDPGDSPTTCRRLRFAQRQHVGVRKNHELFFRIIAVRI